MEKKLSDTCRHIHIALLSTYSHVSHVKEIAHPTPKQTAKHIATAKSKPIQLQSCGVP
ncbi:MAG: hypothetical protein M1540_05710 [Candidatus Bathyarchaeota archaeon]|nr:hypothetical protein [Candidatus Bathyarchaeota archaeon]